MILDFVKKNTIKDSNNCWNWQLSFSSNGYPQKRFNGKLGTVHRALLLELNKVSVSEIVRHTCHNKACCNPDHLVSGNHKDNYNDSAITHKKAAAKRRKTWEIDGVIYPTCRAAVEGTAISMNSVIKFTVNGVFNIEAYRASCKIAGTIPKI